MEEKSSGHKKARATNPPASAQEMAAAASPLTDDLIVEILSRLPARSVHRFKCVSPSWRALIADPANRKKLPQTLAGFLYSTYHWADPRFQKFHLANVSVGAAPPVDLSLSFLPPDKYLYVDQLDACNGLLLCLCYMAPSSPSTDKRTPLESHFIVCNPATKRWVDLPPHAKVPNGHRGVARLGFDPAVSSHFHVLQFEKTDQEDCVTGVNIYSSQTGAWKRRQSRLVEKITLYAGLASVFFHGMLHLLGMLKPMKLDDDAVLVAVDMEGQVWKAIRVPSGGLSFGLIGVSQRCLHYAATPLAPDDKKKKKKRNVVKVDSYGAVGDGCADDTEAFAKAWEKACSLKDAVLVVTKGRRYKIGPSRFMGPCKERLVVLMHGTIVAPEEPSEWDPKSPRLWLLFGGLVGARIQGGGVIDGSGSKWWANSCKVDRSKPCKGAPTAVTIDSCRGVRVRGLTIQNAQQMHLTVSRSRGVRLDGMAIQAPGDSPNTDGIHMGDSSNVSIIDTTIGVGDDCISMGPGTTKVNISGVTCGPGHGISIGSLGRYKDEKDVTDITVKNCVLKGSSNGLRIKSYEDAKSPLIASKITYENIKMEDSGNPIIIDQKYCPYYDCEHKHVSGVILKDITFKNIKGTSSMPVAVLLRCGVPCQGVVLQDVDLKYMGEGGSSSKCENAMATYVGYQHPEPCA
ncbi:exopolygalacturonase [Triticum aestivum]|uniref:exopolygalacturonase n=1 Tax=Triticum aestivum TaxID=4565 RepID=UPI001D01E29A|nr:exopolygalacturonase-like [Triticum aestivum]